MKKILLLSSIALTFAACSKEDKEIDKCNVGSVRFTNNSDNPYKIYVDGGFRRSLSAHSFIDYDLNTGSHSLRALQESGYIFSPTDRRLDIMVNGCDKQEFIFP